MKLKIKKILCLVLTLGATICLLSAMAKKGSSKSASKKSSSVKVISTIFPLYDWAREIASGTDVEITMLVEKGADIHSYQPTFRDIAKISKCDVFLYVGGESESWIPDALKEAKNPNLKSLSMMEALGNYVLEEEEKDGMESECESDCESESDEDEKEYDEHVWLSLKNASVLVDSICNTMCAADSGNASKFKSNAESYKKKISALDSQYQSAVNSAKVKTLVFADRFPFRYLTEDYNLDYFAAFKGCSAENEASFKTVMFLSNKIDELNLENVFVIETSDGKLAKTVIQNSRNKNRRILTLNSMQSTSFSESKKGATYFGIMEKNLDVLKEGLN